MSFWCAQLDDLSRHVERHAGLAALPEFQRELRLDALRVRAHILQLLRTSLVPMKTIQIAVEAGLSDEGARRHLHALRAEGLIECVCVYPAKWVASTAR